MHVPKVDMPRGATRAVHMNIVNLIADAINTNLKSGCKFFPLECNPRVQLSFGTARPLARRGVFIKITRATKLPERDVLVLMPLRGR